MSFTFYVGLHHPSVAHRFDKCMVSANALRTRKSDFRVHEWILDSGAFSEIMRHYGFRSDPEEYAQQIARWQRCGNMVAAVSQDYMCEDAALEKTGATIGAHQLLTCERYVRILAAMQCSVHLMPVLQGYAPAEYAAHVRLYGDLLAPSAWVGVGSVCKRNTSVAEIEDVLLAIHGVRPDLLLHGFGLKLSALHSGIVRDHLHSADSMAWSWTARKELRNPNDWQEAARFVRRVAHLPIQLPMWPL